MIRKLACLVSFCILALSAMAQQTHEKIIRETRYLLYLPDDYMQDTARRFPMMIFLHGSGERGTDLNKVKVNGPPMMIEKGKKYPFIVVSPQAGERGWEESELYNMLLGIQQKYRVDGQRIYLTGLSMGGYGTWEFAMKHPELFAAIAPICGGADTTDIHTLRNMPVWAFHGMKDDVVPPEQSIRVVNALKKYNPSVKLTLYPDANHNSWDVTYNNDSLYTWMLQHTRFTYKQVKVKQSVLNSYAGTYVSNSDTLKVISDKGCIILRVTPTYSVELKPASDKLFFIEPGEPVDIEFVKRGKDEFFIVSQNKRTEYKKISR
ncbi:hypothetical protein DJ568_06800 [Mucilaginibacter hurinus]|uniref:Dienelactone hydrolase domain-containing protein n=1 Tax=Mucilaginibacter hurinus TaxID=2201324 RepID=A0A367GR94_9SPHI|nr:prolyl oligopeptidase family serine peptidase [Mucilaginibacter hurinus]RCH55595.1 hypothetical protein DJ568_06800 [Mucilaginibacter hurinus]